MSIRLFAGPAGFDHKSTALLLRPKPPHFALVGTGAVTIWESDDLLTWRSPTPLLSGRKGSFDSGYVEASAQPVKLSDGNYLTTYDTILKSALRDANPHTLPFQFVTWGCRYLLTGFGDVWQRGISLLVLDGPTL